MNEEETKAEMTETAAVETTVETTGEKKETEKSVT